LQEAQQILLNCGAVSYCLYHLIRCYQTALHLLESMDLPNPTPIQTMLDAFSKTLVHFLTMSGVEVQKEQLIGYQLVLENGRFSPLPFPFIYVLYHMGVIKICVST
jgi:hypothetical protein